MNVSRRMFLKTTGAAMIVGAFPMSLVKVAFGAPDPSQDFTFAYISDAHIQHIEGTKFVRNWDMGLIRAIREANLLTPKPDFFMFGGDLGQLGKREELDHGLEIMSSLRGKVYYVIGEHDYYLDLGDYWQSEIGPLWYSFDHKGVHFIVLNSILTYDSWTHKNWGAPLNRMLAMARLDNPEGSPFMVG
jgi:Icc protein